MLINSVERPHKCTECEKTFKQQQHLKAHLLTHYGDRPYECNECDKTFIRQQHLKDHMVIHTGSGLKWNEKTVDLLLQSYLQRRDLFRNPEVKKATLWNQIREEFIAHGYETSWENLDTKFRNLKKTYCEKKKSGKGSGKWEFYNTFEEIFSQEVVVYTDQSRNVEDSCYDEMGPEAEKIEEENPNYNEIWEDENYIEYEVETGQKRKRDECDDKAGPSSNHPHDLAKQSKKMLNLEEERVLALKNISKCLEESLKLQKEQLDVQKKRNGLLSCILEKLSKIENV